MFRLAAIFAGTALSVAGVAAAGRLLFPQTPLPRAVRFDNGAVIVSCGVFALLACGIGYTAVFLLLAGLLLAAALRTRCADVVDLPALPPFIGVILAAYALLYLVYALAPEIQPDAFGYHLRLVSEYARLHAFSNRIMFYDMLPQGMEMLFVPAFALGGAAAAKLVHLVFLCATIPLMRQIAREAGLTAHAGSVGAALFFLAPVCGVVGTAAYTDAGLVCAVCAVLCLLLQWDRERLRALLVCAGLNAGFCYTIKPTFGWVAALGACFVLLRGRRLLPAVSFAALALAVVLPWAVRSYWFTANPAAPFLSVWFPNPVSTPALEHDLAASFSAWRPGFSWASALFDYTVTGGHQGLFGAAFLLLPLALFALRRKGGRWLLGASALLAVPVLLNTGTRFLLPAMVPASLALASVLPGPAGFALVAVQAVAAAPPVIDYFDRLYARKYEWRLRAFPLQAALGLVTEDAYLRQNVPQFAVRDLVQENTRPGAAILTLAPVPEAYIPRPLLIYWQSVAAQHYTDALDFAFMSHGTRARLLSWRWQCGKYKALRFTALSDVRVVEAHLQHGETAAQSWKSMVPGSSVDISASAGVTGADLLIWPGDQAKEDTRAMSDAGVWEPIGTEAARAPHIIDLRRDATAYIRRSGYHYILVPVADDAFAEMGADMKLHSFEWGVEAMGHTGNMWLFRILPDLL